ncbi:MAG: chorismate mutase [Anaerolineales bacterium]|nr:chorismate mutase [Anaerolineales bacterium]
MTVRGVRGAITVEANETGAILEAARELLTSLLQANPGMKPEDLASALFTLTEDLTAAFPAQAARELGWREVPLLCAREIPVPGGLPMTLRLLLHWNTELPQKQVRHVYLRGAQALRPDLSPSSRPEES